MQAALDDFTSSSQMKKDWHATPNSAFTRCTSHCCLSDYVTTTSHIIHAFAAHTYPVPLLNHTDTAIANCQHTSTIQPCLSCEPVAGDVLQGWQPVPLPSPRARKHQGLLSSQARLTPAATWAAIAKHQDAPRLPQHRAQHGLNAPEPSAAGLH